MHCRGVLLTVEAADTNNYDPNTLLTTTSSRLPTHAFYTNNHSNHSTQTSTC